MTKCEDIPKLFIESFSKNTVLRKLDLLLVVLLVEFTD